MRAMLDACVLYPTVMREMLLGAAAEGFFAPLWSARVLDEWRHAAARLGPEGAAPARVQAEAEIALARARWPGAMVAVPEGLEARLYLPDPADTHVLAAAIAGEAEVLVTLNARDFPRGLLAEEGLSRAGPDALLMGFFAARPEAMAAVARRVQAEAERLSGAPWPLRKLLKKAGLPRLGKALERRETGGARGA